MSSRVESPRSSKLFVAVDFGTTYCGISFRVVTNGVPQGDAARSVRAWPCSRAGCEKDEAKVPTKLRYRRDRSGNPVPHQWGYELENEDDDDLTFEWFKLLLLRDEDIPQHLRNSPQLQKARRRMEAIGLTPVRLVSDYLALLWKHALGDEHNDEAGLPGGDICSPLGRVAVSLMPLHVVLTVPAIWKKYARDAMVDAAVSANIIGARTAGHTTFNFISEPEAAAHAYADEITQRLDVGNTLLVCDLGGGTGDCISYRVTEGQDRASLGLEEVVPGDGELCGAMFLDEAFMKLLRTTIDRTAQPTTPAGWKTLLRQEWELTIKRHFVYIGDKQTLPWKITLSALSDQSVYLHEDQLRDVFHDSVVPKILKLVQAQYDAIVKATGTPPALILLVGGFGRCPFIRKLIQAKFASKKRKWRIPTEVLLDRGEMPWLAISKGAVNSVTDKARVKSRKARQSIGFIQSREASADDGGSYDYATNEYRIHDSMDWVFKRGDDISSCSKILPKVLTFEDGAKGKASYEADFFAYTGEHPPARYHTGEGLEDCGTMKIQVPRRIEDLPLEDHGAICTTRVFNYDLHIQSSGVSVDITAATVGENSQEVGTLTLKQDASGWQEKNTSDVK